MKTKILNILLLIACVAVFVGGLVGVVAFSIWRKDFPTPSGSIYTEPTIYQQSAR